MAVAKLAAVLEISDDFDQFFEAEPLLEPVEAHPSVETMLSYLQVSSRADVNRVIDRLPVFPQAAREVIRCARDPEAGVRELEEAASKDPVLAATVIRTANSAFHSPVRPIGAIQHAIAYIGPEMARKVLLAASLRPNFVTPRLRPLWNHCLDVAQTAEHLARSSKLQRDASGAFLAGLVHDIGRLAFSIMPAGFLDR